VKLRSLLFLTALLVILPFVNPSKTLSIQILIWGLLAISYNLLLGYTGLLSFGHAIFFGLGAYASGLCLKYIANNVYLELIAGVLLATAGAAIIGWFCLRRRGVYFAMLTLAFGQMIYFLAYQLDFITGGEDGLTSIPTPSLAIPKLISIPLVSIQHPYVFYFFCLAFVLATLIFLELLVRTPFGQALQAIRESEERSLATGYNTMAVQWLAFIMAGAIAGLAGALSTLYLGFVPIDALSLATSGTVLIMTILGGKGLLVGPFVGAGLFLGMQDVLSAYTDSWQLIVGAVFVLVVIALPAGIAGTLANLASAFLDRNARTSGFFRKRTSALGADTEAA
jgi:branched-chain amino acid transport system permease protein